jgi:hypothetical protein
VSRQPVRRLIALIIALVALGAPTGASAATVVNGNFETGTLAGWQQFSQTESGEWFAYDELEAEVESFFPPPQGNFAAGDDQGDPDTDVLFQDIALEPAFNHRLALTLYYDSNAPITVPSPNTLEIGGAPENQQLRVDVVKPGAPILSLNPADILTTVFANKNGDPEFMFPTVLSANLTPFAGQTVRLRIANAVQESVFNTGIDSVSITSTPVPPPPLPPAPSNAIVRGKLTLNKSNGTGKLAIQAPGPGTLLAVGKGKTKKVKRASLAVTAAGTVKVPLNPNGAGKKVLNSKGKLKTQIDVTFTPTGGTAATQTYKVTLKKNLPKN